MDFPRSFLVSENSVLSRHARVHKECLSVDLSTSLGELLKVYLLQSGLYSSEVGIDPVEVVD